MMKTIIKSTLLLLSVFLAVGCKLDTSHNGKLDGYWKLTTVDTLQTGGICNLTDASIFWAVEKDLLVARDNNDPGIREYVFRFAKADNTLSLSDAHLYNKVTGNIAVEDLSVLAPLGINHQPEVFKIDKLSSSTMTLSTDELRLSFKKF